MEVVEEEEAQDEEQTYSIDNPPIQKKDLKAQQHWKHKKTPPLIPNQTSQEIGKMKCLP